jgi:hypothetical protein
MTTADFINRVLERSAADAVFRATALHDPVAAFAQIAREHGRTIRGEDAESVVFVRSSDHLDRPSDDPRRAVVVLPDAPPDPRWTGARRRCTSG